MTTTGLQGAGSPATVADDHREIIDLTVAYCYVLDERRFDDLASIFSADAVADYGSVVCHGIDEIVEKVSGSIASMDATQHVVTNHRVTVDGDTARSFCYLQSQHVVRGTPGGELYMIAGRYEDELVRTAAGWRIEYRRLVRVWSDGNPEVAGRS
jgi:hypothetical protein